MSDKKLIKEIKLDSFALKFFKKYILNKYIITIFIFLVWMIFIDDASFLVINDLNQDINKYEHQLDYYKSEYEKNDKYYKKLMNNKDEKEKYARENYFMKKADEEIFILVKDTLKTNEINKN